MADKASFNISVDGKSLSSMAQFELGFIESSDPRKFKAMLQLATLNAARTMVKPVKAEAPVQTGRLRGAVAARKAKYGSPAAVVGVKAGASRGDVKGAWYRYMVISGHAVRGTKKASAGAISWAQAAAGAKRAGSAISKRVRANNFVARATQNGSVQAKAMDTIASTINAFLTGKIKYRGRRA
jgi:hypothetical protein